MAKKIDPTKKSDEVKPAKKVAAPKSKTAVKQAAVQTEFEEKTVTKPTKKAAAPKAKKEIVITAEEIAHRAYFIAEHRQQNGYEGDSHQDWIEAERQLVAVASQK